MSLLYFSNFLLGLPPIRMGEGNPISFIFKWTIWESCGLHNPGKLGYLVYGKNYEMLIVEAPCSIRARWLCYFQHCSCRPNSASRTDAKWLCPLALACRLNLMPQCNYTSRSLTTTSYGLETDPVTFLSYGLQESHSLWDWAALFPFTSKPPLHRLPRSPVQH